MLSDAAPWRCILALVILGNPLPGRDAEAVGSAESGQAIDVLTTTYAERSASGPAGQPAIVRELCFPLTTVARWVPSPFVVEAGERPRQPHADPAQAVWRRVPWTDQHQTYLAKRVELAAPERAVELIDWCERQGLGDCAAYEIRRAMAPLFMRFMDPAYQRLNTRWQRYAGGAMAPWAFPLPVAGTWRVLPDPTRHHRMKSGATFAVDLQAEVDGKRMRGDGRMPEDHFSFGCEVLAQADGIVVVAEGGQPDQPIGKLGAFGGANTVIVDYGGGVRGLYAHLRQGSLRVSVGDRVGAGQVLGQVGNSGASGAPHLHLTLVDNDHVSIRARYRIEVLRGTRWVLAQAEELVEGTLVRNQPTLTPAPARPTPRP